MDHDEFATRPARTRPTDDAPGFALEFGGGLALGFAANLDPSTATVFLGLG